MSLVGVAGGDSSTGRSALPGIGFQTPSRSKPTCRYTHSVNGTDDHYPINSCIAGVLSNACTCTVM